MLSEKKIPDPVFIIGHWRTGTTLLHKLMSLDPNLIAPTLFHVAIPDGFLTSYRFYRPVMKMMVSPYRPMDMVKMGIDEPQEDEYALLRLTGYSPLTHLIFPESGKYYLDSVDSYLPEHLNIKEWEEAYLHFFRKLHLLSGKRVVSKNPFNSMRIKELRTIFPGARFIHIYRNPFCVIPSTRNMFRIVQRQNNLNKNMHDPTIPEVTAVFDRIMTSIRKSLSSLPAETYYEIRFEGLESNPVESLKGIYSHFRLDFSADFEAKVKNYVAEVKDYRKNEFQLTDEEKNFILQKLENHLKYYHYL
jgi:omega-hydroxy-beta-dihydromenaquinone-9 sulfotransferase